ncbi:MAG: hypothetical protein HYS61_05740, partial [Acidobacteria bacterium]|nr:hypothetical protein [Acidobacteriota bacterium]
VEKATLLIDSPADLPGMKAGEAVPAAAFEETLEPLAGARVLARFADGEPGIVVKSLGKGNAILVGSFLALAYQRELDPASKRLLLAFGRAAGVPTQIEVTGPNTREVEVRRLTRDGVQFLFAFNHTSTPAEATISLELPWPTKSARDLETDREVAFRSAGEKTVLEKTLEARGIWVVRLEK